MVVCETMLELLLWTYFYIHVLNVSENVDALLKET